MKWSFSKLQIREEGLSNVRAGSFPKKIEGGMSLDRFVFLFGSLRLCNIHQGWAM
jgi:hypothetical protein